MSEEGFSVQDRLALLSVLPDKGNITTLHILRVLREELSFSEDEHAALELVTLPDTVHWNPDHKVPDKTIEVGDKARDVIATALKQADQRQDLADLHIPLWDRFVGD